MKNYYIDFDGVILDTIGILFKIHKERNIPFDILVNTINWKYLLENSEIINDSIYILQNTSCNYKIITKFNTYDELQEKILYLRKNNIKSDVIGVPIRLKKTDVHIPTYDDILIDDQIDNVLDWINSGGNAYYFDYGNYSDNNTCQKIKRLDEILK